MRFFANGSQQWTQSGKGSDDDAHKLLNGSPSGRLGEAKCIIGRKDTPQCDGFGHRTASGENPQAHEHAQGDLGSNAHLQPMDHQDGYSGAN